MEAYFSIALTIGLTAYGQLIIKSRANVLSAASGSRLDYVLAMFTDPWVLSAYAGALIAGASWFFVLKHFNLAFAYPFMALTFLVVPLGAAVLFKEPVGMTQALGLVLIVLGVGLSAAGHGSRLAW